MGRIRIILPDPDRDWHPRHADPDPADTDRYESLANGQADKLYFFPENFNMLSKKLEIITSLTLTRKIKHCKLAMDLK